MDVIGAGFGRTGTLSLKLALEQLGLGPCMHMVPLLEDPGRAALFSQAAEGDVDSLDAALDGYRSTVDWPGTYFWRVLADRHPDAKVVLSVREPEQWYDSAYRTIYSAANARRADAVEPGYTAVMEMVDATVWGGTFGGRFADREASIRLFEEHNDAVRREIAPGRLLEFQVVEGWGPLCEFLGRPVPSTPFPRVNDSAAFNEKIRRPIETRSGS